MVKPSIFDMAIDEVLKRQRLVTTELERRGKNKKPFRMEPMSEQEQLDEYNSLYPEVKRELRVASPEWAAHEEDMIKMLIRRQKDARL